LVLVALTDSAIEFNAERRNVRGRQLLRRASPTGLEKGSAHSRARDGGLLIAGAAGWPKRRLRCKLKTESEGMISRPLRFRIRNLPRATLDAEVSLRRRRILRQREGFVVILTVSTGRTTAAAGVEKSRPALTGPKPAGRSRQFAAPDRRGSSEYGERVHLLASIL